MCIERFSVSPAWVSNLLPVVGKSHPEVSMNIFISRVWFEGSVLPQGI